MRVIAGKARHLNLTTVGGLETRPTTDRIKETLFNMINNDLYGARFLDLFSGSGGIGIEALSRGASLAVFVENNPKACKCIKENLSYTKLNDNAILYECDYSFAINRIKSSEPFDFIFMDPPYNKFLEKNVLLMLKNTSIVDDSTTIIIEASLETNFSYLDEYGYRLIKEKIYKTNKHVFIRKQENP